MSDFNNILSTKFKAFNAKVGDTNLSAADRLAQAEPFVGYFQGASEAAAALVPGSEESAAAAKAFDLVGKKLDLLDEEVNFEQSLGG